MVAERRLRLRADLMEPFPKQEDFLDALYSHECVLYGGAMGPGKSYALRWGALELLLYWFGRYGHRGVHVGLFSADYPTLIDRQVSKIAEEFPDYLGAVKERRDQGWGFHLRPEFGAGVIALRNLDRPEKYKSAEFAAVFVDELTECERPVFDMLRTRLRWPGIPHNPFAGATNPGGVGHGWVKKLWVDRDFTGPDDQRLNPEDFHFIKALPSDNPHLTETYWARLRAMNERLRRAYLEGNWDVFEGQAFPEFSRAQHVIAPFDIPANWVRWTATDYGYAAPWCTLWLARSPDKRRVVVYREQYAKGVRASEQAKRIKFGSARETIRLHVADPSMWAQREKLSTASLAEEYAAEGVALVPANNDRISGKGRVHEALAWEELAARTKPPRLQIFDTCANLIRTLPALPLDEHKQEDVDSEAEDHAYDALRYGLMLEEQHTKVEPEKPRKMVMA